MEPSREHQRVPGPSLWPVGVGLGLVVLLAGFAIAWWVVALGAVVTAVFGVLWTREGVAEAQLDEAAEFEPERRGQRIAGEPGQPEPVGGQQRGLGPALWPVGVGLGLVLVLAGVAIAWWLVALGVAVTVVFGVLWTREGVMLARLDEVAEFEPERRGQAAVAESGELEPIGPEPASYTREKFLEVSTLGLGAIIGGLITAPALGFTVLPAFLNQGRPDHDLGPLDLYPEGEWRIATFPTRPDIGDVTRVTMFVRYNGLLEEQPSFTILSNHCVHLGCPVQPNGPVQEEERSKTGDVTLIPTEPSGFGCPCHGGQYDNEGNRTAGPPVRALDRFAYSIREGRLYAGHAFSVSTVEGTGADAIINKWKLAYPGVHVDGPQSWLYPIQPPSS